MITILENQSIDIEMSKSQLLELLISLIFEYARLEEEKEKQEHIKQIINSF